MTAPLSRIPWVATSVLALILAADLVSCGGDTDDRTTRGATSLAGPTGGVVESAGAVTDGAGGAGGSVGAGGDIGAGGGVADCGSLPGSECYGCCTEQNPAGATAFESSFFVCGCLECQLDCAQSLCGGGIAPQAGCIGCAAQSIAPGGSCGMAPEFAQSCTNELDCDAFVACLAGC